MEVVQKCVKLIFGHSVEPCPKPILFGPSTAGLIRSWRRVGRAFAPTVLPEHGMGYGGVRLETNADCPLAHGQKFFGKVGFLMLGPVESAPLQGVG